jgi:choline transport protein
MSLLAILLTIIISGSDATAHMAEEVKDAGLNVPKAMVWSFVLNGVLGLFFIITYLFCLPSVEDALNDPTTFPFLYVFRQAVSIGGVNALTAVILILAIASNIAFNASTSRQTFAFARDNGLPFPKWVAHVHPTLQVPANAVTLTCGITMLLSLINIGSTAAFNAIISLQIVALMASYSISISCVLYRRLTNTLPHARWSLGKFGIPVNIFGIAYALFAFFWCFWPNATPLDVGNFNWAVVIFIGMVISCIVAYFVKGRKLYVGPVMHVEGRGEHM